MALSILITSDERESKREQGFEMLRSCLPDFAFPGSGPHYSLVPRPLAIITDNCKEARNTLKSVWPSTILLLCIFHVLQKLWRWLHENYGHNINQADLPHILSLFKGGFYLKAVFTAPKIGLTEISRSRFKQYKNPTLISQINVLWCFLNFLVIFRYIWEEIVFFKRVVKFGEIRNS